MLSSTNKSQRKSTIKVLISVLVITLLCVGLIALRLNASDNEASVHSGRRLAEITRQEMCSSRRCCINRDPVQKMKFDCMPFTIKECVKYDKLCVWQCDKYKLKTKKFGHFIGFDQGTGRNDELYADKYPQKDDQIKPEGDAKSIDEIIKRNTWMEWSECGDQYEFILPYNDAVRILKDRRFQRVTIGSETYDQVKEYPDMTQRQYIDRDISKGGRRRNLLTVWTPDGRSQSFSQGQYPRRVFGILVTDSGSWCSGTLIARRVVLTAAHCLYDTGTNSWTGGWTFYPDTTSDTTFGGPSGIGYRWSAARVTRRWVDQTKTGRWYDTWSASRDCDYGMVILRQNAGSTLGWMSFGYDNTLPSKKFNTYGYPSDMPYGTRWFQYCEHGQLFSQQTRSREPDTPDCDVRGGQSGSPNYLYWPSTNRRIIYALTSGHTSTYNVYSRIDKTKFNFICDSVEDFGQVVCF